MAYDTLDPRAPVKSTASLQIAASPETIWAHLVDIGQWPQKFGHVHAASLQGPFAPESYFRWRSGSTVITSTLREVTPHRRIVWTGRATGTQAVHIWEFEPQGTGTLVTTAESFRGWMVMVFPELMRRKLDSSLIGWLADLKRLAEG